MLKRTPLFETHKQLGGRMVEFGGWEMPVQYKSVLEEHRCVRNAVGLFDISHMGEIFVEGEGASDFINYVTTNDIRRIANGGCQYAACCYQNGGIVDDVISYQFSPQKYLVVVNASNTEKDFKWFCQNNHFPATLENQSASYCQLALQGPKAKKVLAPLVETSLSALSYYHFCETVFQGEKIILSRTGYTGEDGFEIYGAWEKAPFFWEHILRAGEEDGILPIGLAARDTLRLEAAYSLYGHEISESIHPLEARQGLIVKLDKKEFIGKEALQKIAKDGAKRQLVGLEMMSLGIPRQGYGVMAGDQKIGFVTSGTFSPTLEKAIALAMVEKPHARVGQEVNVEIRQKMQSAQVIQLPFYRRG